MQSSSITEVNATNIGNLAVPAFPDNTVSGPGWQESIAGPGGLYSNLSGTYYLVAFCDYTPDFGYSTILSGQVDNIVTLVLLGGIAATVLAGILLLAYGLTRLGNGPPAQANIEGISAVSQAQARNILLQGKGSAAPVSSYLDFAITSVRARYWSALPIIAAFALWLTVIPSVFTGALAAISFTVALLLRGLTLYRRRRKYRFLPEGQNFYVTLNGATGIAGIVVASLVAGYLRLILPALAGVTGFSVIAVALLMFNLFSIAMGIVLVRGGSTSATMLRYSSSPQTGLVDKLKELSLTFGVRPPGLAMIRSYIRPTPILGSVASRGKRWIIFTRETTELLSKAEFSAFLGFQLAGIKFRMAEKQKVLPIVLLIIVCDLIGTLLLPGSNIFPSFSWLVPIALLAVLALLIVLSGNVRKQVFRIDAFVSSRVDREAYISAISKYANAQGDTGYGPVMPETVVQWMNERIRRIRQVP